MATVAAVPQEPVFLGIQDEKEYWWDFKTASMVWRVPDIREAIEADDEFVIIAADYSQIEVRIMAKLSGDPALIAAINSGKDIHCVMATEVFGSRMGFDYDVINKARKDENHPRHNELTAVRSRVKTVTFGVPYGAAAPRIAMMTGMTEDEAAELMADYFAKYPVLKKWIEEQGRNALQFGYSSSAYGRKRFYVMPANDDPEYNKIISQIRRWAGNHPIQATSADMTKLALTKIYSRLRNKELCGQPLHGARILFVVHDEIVMTCRAEHGEEVARILKACMDESYDEIIGVEYVIHDTEVAPIGRTWNHL